MAARRRGCPARYDPELNLVYWGTGNPNPDFYGDDRKGDNLYSGALVALDADTGKLKWHYQFTPHDVHDWDANQIPVLADLTVSGTPLKAVMVANRNGFLYILDRATGAFIQGKPFVHQTWAQGHRRRWPAHRIAGSATERQRHADLPGPFWRHQLHVAVLRPRERPAIRVRA